MDFNVEGLKSFENLGIYFELVAGHPSTVEYGKVVQRHSFMRWEEISRRHVAGFSTSRMMGLACMMGF